jgi:hypothetical protein
MMGHNHNRNWLGPHPHIYVTGPNLIGPVHVSPVAVQQPISTGRIKDRLGLVAIGPNLGLNWSFSTKILYAKCVRYYVCNKGIVVLILNRDNKNDSLSVRQYQEHAKQDQGVTTLPKVTKMNPESHQQEQQSVEKIN